MPNSINIYNENFNYVRRIVYNHGIELSQTKIIIRKKEKYFERIIETERSFYSIKQNFCIFPKQVKARDVSNLGET